MPKNALSWLLGITCHGVTRVLIPCARRELISQHISLAAASSCNLSEVCQTLLGNLSTPAFELRRLTPDEVCWSRLVLSRAADPIRAQREILKGLV